MNTSIRSAAASSTGLVRKRNEDSAYAGRFLFAVADGLGGHVGGDVASATAITVLARYDAPVSPADLPLVLAEAVTAANDAIRHRTEREPALRTMGTTLTAMLWSGTAYTLAHIGDSRAYQLRGGQLRQLTEDHTLGNLVSGAVQLPALGAVISRYLDGRPDRSADLAQHQARPGDRYLLCSDGLTAVAGPDTIRAVLESRRDPETAVRDLTGIADNGGGPDNTTIICIAVTGTPDSERDEAAMPVMLGAAATP